MITSYFIVAVCEDGEIYIENGLAEDCLVDGYVSNSDGWISQDEMDKSQYLKDIDDANSKVLNKIVDDYNKSRGE